MDSTMQADSMAMPPESTRMPPAGFTTPPAGFTTPPDDTTATSSRALHNDLAVCIGALGILLNLASLRVFHKRKLLAELPHLILRNQCVIDLLSGVFLIYSQYHSWYLGSTMPDGVPSPAIYCRLIWSTYILWALIEASSWNLQILTIERYVSVCHPFTHSSSTFRRVVKVLMVAVWICGFMYVAILASFMRYYPETNSCIYFPWSAMAAAVYGTAFYIHSYCLPVLLMLGCYSKMLYVLKNRIHTTAAVAVASTTAAKAQRDDLRKVKQMRRFVGTCFMINAAYVACYSLNANYYFFVTMGVLVMQPDTLFYHVSVLMVFINCFINPVIFITKMRSFRVELLHQITCGQLRNAGITAGGSTDGSARSLTHGRSRMTPTSHF